MNVNYVHSKIQRGYYFMPNKNMEVNFNIKTNHSQENDMLEMQDLSNKFFKLRSSDKTILINELDDLLKKAQKEKNTTDNDIVRTYDIVFLLAEKEQEALDILLKYNGLLTSTNYQTYPWDGKSFDAKLTKKRLNEDIITKEVQINIFKKITEFIKTPTKNITNDEKIIIIRASMRFLNTLTLILYSDMTKPAKNNLISLGNIMGFNIKEINDLPDSSNRFHHRDYLLPTLINGCKFAFEKKSSLSSALLKELKEKFHDIAIVVNENYKKIKDENNICVPEYFTLTINMS